MCLAHRDAETSGRKSIPEVGLTDPFARRRDVKLRSDVKLVVKPAVASSGLYSTPEGSVTFSRFTKNFTRFSPSERGSIYHDRFPLFLARCDDNFAFSSLKNVFPVGFFYKRPRQVLHIVSALSKGRDTVLIWVHDTRTCTRARSGIRGSRDAGATFLRQRYMTPRRCRGSTCLPPTASFSRRAGRSPGGLSRDRMRGHAPERV